MLVNLFSAFGLYRMLFCREVSTGLSWFMRLVTVTAIVGFVCLLLFISRYVGKIPAGNIIMQINSIWLYFVYIDKH
jgi:hypothetical protein